MATLIYAFATNIDRTVEATLLIAELDQLLARDQWMLDVDDLEHRLLVFGGADLNTDIILKAVERSGFRATFIRAMPVYC